MGTTTNLLSALAKTADLVQRWVQAVIAAISLAVTAIVWWRFGPAWAVATFAILALGIVGITAWQLQHQIDQSTQGRTRPDLRCVLEADRVPDASDAVLVVTNQGPRGIFRVAIEIDGAPSSRTTLPWGPRHYKQRTESVELFTGDDGFVPVGEFVPRDVSDGLEAKVTITYGGGVPYTNRVYFRGGPLAIVELRTDHSAWPEKDDEWRRRTEEVAAVLGAFLTKIENASMTDNSLNLEMHEVVTRLRQSGLVGYPFLKPHQAALSALTAPKQGNPTPGDFKAAFRPVLAEWISEIRRELESA